MQEWSNKNKFNSFNSWKGLLYAKWYRAIADKKFLPPVEAAISPIHTCNLHCQHCNSGKYMNYNTTIERMEDSHLIWLIDFFVWWGVKGICFAGGGEPTLHTKLGDAIRRCAELGIASSILTNGVNLNENNLDAIRNCTWAGISIDASTRETFYKLKGVDIDIFDTVIRNIGKLARNPGKCKVAYKFLISSMNQYEIFDACQLAKELGVHDFHARPMDYHHEGMLPELDGKLFGLDILEIEKQFNLCHELETDNFKVHTVTHKFNPDFTPNRDFSQCYGGKQTQTD